MFKLKTEDFVKILEQNSITPKSTKMRTGSGGKLFIERHITPSGSFWEYQLMFTYAPFISILVSDGEKKVLAKSFTLTPKDGNEEGCGCITMSARTVRCNTLHLGTFC